MAYQSIEECAFTQKINALIARKDLESMNQSNPKKRRLPPAITLGEAITKSIMSLNNDINVVPLCSSRQPHFELIKNEIVEAILNSQGVTIYACGLPGTGKTMVINEVIAALNQQFPSTDTLRQIFVQGTAVDSQLLYINIASQLNIVDDDIESIGSSFYKNIKDRVLKILSTSKSTSKKSIPRILLCIEEIDQAPYEELRILMNLSAEVGSKLIVIGTGNNSTLIPDLRLCADPLIVVFEEFSKDQLIDILTARTYGEIVQPVAIDFIAMKMMRHVHGNCVPLFSHYRADVNHDFY